MIKSNKIKGFEMLIKLCMDTMDQADIEYYNNLDITSYNKFIIAYDPFLSGWGRATDKRYYHIVLIKNDDDFIKIRWNMKQSKLQYINYYYINDIEYIRGLKKKDRTYSLKQI